MKIRNNRQVLQLVDEIFASDKINEELYDTTELKLAYKAGIWDGIKKIEELENKEKQDE